MIDDAQNGAHRGVERGVDHSIDRVDHVGRIEVGAIMKLDARMQLQRPLGHGIVRCPRVGQFGNRAEVFVDTDQTIEDHVDGRPKPVAVVGVHRLGPSEASIVRDPQDTRRSRGRCRPTATRETKPSERNSSDGKVSSAGPIGLMRGHSKHGLVEHGSPSAVA